jgi:hypothetical protein
MNGTSFMLVAGSGSGSTTAEQQTRRIRRMTDIPLRARPEHTTEIWPISGTGSGFSHIERHFASETTMLGGGSSVAQDLPWPILWPMTEFSLTIKPMRQPCRKND